MVLLKTWKHGENINVREEIFLCTTLPLLSSCWFTCIIEGLLFNWKSTHSIHLNVEGVLSNPTGLIYCKYLDWYFWIGVRGSYVIYITTNGVGGFALLDSSKKHHMWTQPPAANMLLPVCFCCFSQYGVYKPSVTLILLQYARCWLLIRGWGCLPPHSCFGFWVVFFIHLWYDREANCTYFSLCPFSCVFYCSDHCLLVRNNVLFISAAFFFY